MDDEQECCYPKVLAAVEIGDIGIGDLTPAQRAYRRLCTDLLERFNEQKPRVTRMQAAAGSWLGIGLA